jgi:hypothetical protein
MLPRSTEGEHGLNLDWQRLKAVVFESDDWGLCAWSPDVQAFRVLADTPAFRTEAGRRYASSTLESAQDVRQLAATLNEFRGADGFPPVWQANTIVASPDYERLVPPLFPCAEMPVIDLPATPSRWQRPGLFDAIAEVRGSGVWWPELHGHTHLPEQAWLTALRRGAADARRAHEQQSPVCSAVEASSEYDPTEPRELRARHIARAVEKFTALFGVRPTSMCPPDYRWDEDLESDAEKLGVTTIQGLAEQHGHRFPRLRRLMRRHRWPQEEGRRFHMPARIAFEPLVAAAGPGQAAEVVRRAAHEAWNRSQPAVISTHRVNYAQLDPERAAAGRAALRDLLKVLVDDSAVFLIDAEVRELQERGWSLRPVGDRGVLVRYYGVPKEPIRFPAPTGVRAARQREGRTTDAAETRVDDGTVTARLNVGEYLFEWERA